MKMVMMLVCLSVVAGCSSPPPPTPVDWDKTPTAMNGTLPEWRENYVVNPAPHVDGKWSRVIRSFSTDTPYGVDVYYAVVHSSFVMVTANNADDFFNAKSWLRTHGAKGVIRYQKSEFSWSGRNTDIYLSR
ncbi:cag pathogenicity island Cag12 family protein [Serratia marcescens]|uniref:cag pathogenicity island Cag12 family protein n=1 Tax=Serratia marcescens TaxID=615 RepID=UPI0024A6386D|nr:cag pathogenicity island Cag12 family protein [Serratia marcescens]